MAISNGYCSVAELGQAMGLSADEITSETSRIEAAIEQSSRHIDMLTKKVWYEQTLTEEVCDRYAQSEKGIKTGEYNIIFPVPILTITAIEEDDEALTENADYYVYKGESRIAREGRWTRERKGIKITGTMGYAATPEHIKRYCITIAEVFTKLGNRLVTDEGESVQTALTSYIPKWVRDALRAEAFNRV